MSVTGTADAPSKAGISIADIAAGMYGYTGIFTALFQRERTGKGTAFDVSMFEALGEWMGFPAYFANYGGSAPPRTGAAHATIHPYGPFAAGDGKTVFFGIQNEREWASFCATVLEQPGLTADPRFDSNSHRDAHRQALTEVDRAASSADSPRHRWWSVWTALRSPTPGLNTMQEFWEHQQLDGPPPLARGGHPERQDQSTGARGDHAGRGSAHGSDPRSGTAYTRDPWRARLRRGVHRAPRTR